MHSGNKTSIHLMFSSRSKLGKKKKKDFLPIVNFQKDNSLRWWLCAPLLDSLELEVPLGHTLCHGPSFSSSFHRAGAQTAAQVHLPWSFFLPMMQN